MALPYITLASLAVSAQNPPLDAARLDIMVPLLWGRAEGMRTLREAAIEKVLQGETTVSEMMRVAGI